MTTKDIDVPGALFRTDFHKAETIPDSRNSPQAQGIPLQSLLFRSVIFLSHLIICGIIPRPAGISVYKHE
jgi:hypothetical protein